MYYSPSPLDELEPESAKQEIAAFNHDSPCRTLSRSREIGVVVRSASALSVRRVCTRRCARRVRALSDNANVSGDAEDCVRTRGALVVGRLTEGLERTYTTAGVAANRLVLSSGWMRGARCHIVCGPSSRGAGPPGD